MIAKNIWNHLTACKQMSSNNSFKNKVTHKLFTWKSYIYKFKLATLVEGDPKAPFSTATTQRYKEGRYSIPTIAPLHSWSLPYIYLPNPSARAGYDTRSIFKRSLTGLKSEFSFS